jgi:hypothetical protein
LPEKDFPHTTALPGLPLHGVRDVHPNPGTKQPGLALKYKWLA